METKGRTVEEAVAEALKELNVTEDEVDITIIDVGSKGGLFGIGAKPARVKVELKPAPPAPIDPMQLAIDFIEEVVVSMGLELNITKNKRDRHLYLNLTGENIGILIGKRGSTLDALQYLANLAANRTDAPNITVILDSENYRRRRRDTLEALAIGVSKKVKATRKPISLEPMSRYDRHIIHSFLQNSRQVRTHSEGDEPYRYVMVSPK